MEEQHPIEADEPADDSAAARTRDRSQVCRVPPDAEGRELQSRSPERPDPQGHPEPSGEVSRKLGGSSPLFKVLLSLIQVEEQRSVFLLQFFLFAHTVSITWGASFVVLIFLRTLSGYRPSLSWTGRRVARGRARAGSGPRPASSSPRTRSPAGGQVVAWKSIGRLHTSHSCVS